MAATFGQFPANFIFYGALLATKICEEVFFLSIERLKYTIILKTNCL